MTTQSSKALETAEDKIFSALEEYARTGKVTPRVEFTIDERDAIHEEWIRSLNLPPDKTEESI